MRSNRFPAKSASQPPSIEARKNQTRLRTKTLRKQIEGGEERKERESGRTGKVECSDERWEWKGLQDAEEKSHTVQFRNLFDASPESYSLERAGGTEDRARRLETFVFDPTRGRAQCTRMYFLFLFLLCPPFLRDAIERRQSFLAPLAGSRRRVSSSFFSLFFLLLKNKRIFGWANLRSGSVLLLASWFVIWNGCVI